MIALDMRVGGSLCDYFVIASANSLRQVNAVAHGIDDAVSAAGIRTMSRIPAEDASAWLVLDYGSVIVHVFHKPQREFYALERLWSDAKRVRIPGAALRRSGK